MCVYPRELDWSKDMCLLECVRVCVRACKPERAGFACVCLCVSKSERKRESTVCVSLCLCVEVCVDACMWARQGYKCVYVCVFVRVCTCGLCVYACANPYVSVFFFFFDCVFVHAH